MLQLAAVFGRIVVFVCISSFVHSLVRLVSATKYCNSGGYDRVSGSVKETSIGLVPDTETDISQHKTEVNARPNRGESRLN